MPSVTIPARFNGPPTSGNGGYVCGAIANAIGEPVEVTLRLPPPLETPLTITATAEGWVVTADEAVIAEATQVDEWPPPAEAPPTIDHARAAAERYLGHVHHEFPTCFTCGPARDDGLRIFSGPVEGSSVVAAPWSPDASLVDDGVVMPPIVWAALDCPGAWSAMRARTDAPVVLGRMKARIDRPPTVGEDLVSYGWLVHREGRKALAGTALADAAGTVVAWSAQTWIALG